MHEVVDPALNETSHGSDGGGDQRPSTTTRSTSSSTPGTSRLGQPDQGHIGDDQHRRQQRPGDRTVDRQPQPPQPLPEHGDQQGGREEQLRAEMHQRRRTLPVTSRSNSPACASGMNEIVISDTPIASQPRPAAPVATARAAGAAPDRSPPARPSTTTSPLSGARRSSSSVLAHSSSLIGERHHRLGHRPRERVCEAEYRPSPRVSTPPAIVISHAAARRLAVADEPRHDQDQRQGPRDPCPVLHRLHELSSGADGRSIVSSVHCAPKAAGAPPTAHDMTNPATGCRTRDRSK